MSRVISFKVNDATYFKLKKQKKSFKELFEPIALDLVKNNEIKAKYTGSIRQSITADGTIGNDLKMIIERILEAHSYDR